MAARKQRRSGQAAVEFALVYVGVIIPLTFGMIFLCEMLWVWHSVVELTRDGARYASTHCYEADGGNVTSYMQSHVPLMIDMQQFIQGPAQLNVVYYAKDPDTGQLTTFSCPTDCSVDCEPDAVSVSVGNYEFSRFLTYLKLPPITIPPFTTSLPMESVGCDPQAGTCLP